VNGAATLLLASKPARAANRESFQPAGSGDFPVARRRIAGFQTCRIADFQIGWRSNLSAQPAPRPRQIHEERDPFDQGGRAFDVLGWWPLLQFELLKLLQNPCKTD